MSAPPPKAKTLRPVRGRTARRPKSSPKAFVMLTDQDRQQLQRLCNGATQIWVLIYLLRETYSAPDSPKAVALTAAQIAAEIGAKHESTVERALDDAVKRGLLRKWSIGDAVAGRLMKSPAADVDRRTNAWEPMRESWPGLMSWEEFDAQRAKPEAAAEPAEQKANPKGVTLRAGAALKPIPIEPSSDKNVLVEVAKGSLPVTVSTARGGGAMVVTVHAEPPEVPPVGAGERKAKTVDTTAVIELLNPVFERLFKRPIDEDLARRIIISLGNTPLELFRSVVRERIRRNAADIQTGLFLTLANQASEMYGTILLRQARANMNGHAPEAPATKSHFDIWCAENGMVWTTGGQLIEAQTRYERETGRNPLDEF
jgi:hypothetical protein